MRDFLLEVVPRVGALFVFLVVLAAATFIVTVTISMFLSPRRGQSMAEQREDVRVAVRRFLHVVGTELRLYDFLDWLESKLRRRCDPTQFKLVPILPSKCCHDSPPDDDRRCPDCGMLFVRVVYDDWLALDRPKYLYRSLHECVSGVLDKDIRIRVNGGEVIELVPREGADDDAV